MKIYHLSYILLVSAVTTSAEDFGDDFFPQLPVVTSASRLAESVLKSASAVTVIDRTLIEASGFVELADIFRLVPGFQVAYVNGHTYAVTPHGGGWEYPNRLQLLIDGRSTYLSSLSAVDWTTLGIHLEDIERIEVVRGPAASAYGSNSFAGAINIITREPQFDDKNYVRTRFGNNGERSHLLKHSSHTDNFAYRMTASTIDSDGFDELPDSRNLQDIAINTRLDLDNFDTIKTAFTYVNGSTGTDGLGGVRDPDLSRSIQAISGHVNWSHILSDSEEIKVNFYHNFREDNDVSDSYLLSQIFGADPADIPLVLGVPDQTFRIGERTSHAHRSDLEAQYTQVNPNGMQYVVGIGARYDTLASEALFPRAGTVSDTSFRFFGNLQLPIKSHLTANFGGLYEISRIEESHFSPKLSLNWQVSEFQSIRAAVSRAYRMPSLLEKHIDTNVVLANGLVLDELYASSDDLGAETVDSYELGYLGQSSSVPLNWEFKLYKEQYRDLIIFAGDYRAADTVRRVMNYDELDTHGLEGEVTYRPRQNDFIRFTFNLGHGKGSALYRIYNTGPLFDTLDRTVPRNSFGVLASKEIFDIQWNLGIYHVGDSEWRSAGDIVESYTRVDASVSKGINLDKDKKLTFKIGAQNLGKSHYNEFMDDVEFEPRYYVTLSLTQR